MKSVIYIKENQAHTIVHVAWERYTFFLLLVMVGKNIILPVLESKFDITVNIV